MKKLFKFFWSETTVPIGNNQVIEFGGFVICILIFLLSLFLLDKCGVDIGRVKEF